MPPEYLLDDELDEDNEEPADDYHMHSSTISNMGQMAILKDVQPIRATCFSPQGDFFVLGTNSKALKICKLPNLEEPGNQ